MENCIENVYNQYQYLLMLLLLWFSCCCCVVSSFFYSCPFIFSQYSICIVLCIINSLTIFGAFGNQTQFSLDFCAIYSIQSEQISLFSYAVLFRFKRYLYLRELFTARFINAIAYINLKQFHLLTISKPNTLNALFLSHVFLSFTIQKASKLAVETRTTIN